MPQCTYCAMFLQHWNQIHDEFKAEYGDRIKFLKVDGTRSRQTAKQYEIQGYPSFIALRPGSQGQDWHLWDPQPRSYFQMRKWINQLIKTYDILPIGAVAEPQNFETTTIPAAAIEVEKIDEKVITEAEEL